MNVYLLLEENESGNLVVEGVFSTHELAEKAHHEYERIFTKHWPSQWMVVEHNVDFHVWKLKEHFGVEL